MTNAVLSSYSASEESLDNGRTLERFIAAAFVVIVAYRVQVPHLYLLTAGDALAIALAPVWLPGLRRYANTGAWIGLGVLALISGALLTWLSAVDHAVSRQAELTNNFLLIGLLASVGVLLWARERLGTNTVILLFGLGSIAGVNRSAALFAEGPWKFGYATGVTLLVLGLSRVWQKRGVDLLLVLVLVVVSAATDSRSVFAILLLIAALLAWQARPMARSHRGSAVRGLLGLGLAGAVILNVGQTVILSGLLGLKTQQRSIQQLNETGSLILGGRPEVSATLAMMRHHFSGYGSGTVPSYDDIMVAKTGMASINYDPNNGYVEKFMFGGSYELHSVIGDAWARFGVVGLAFIALAVLLIAVWVGRAVTSSRASGVVLFLTISSLWNIAFSPFYGAISVLSLTMAVIAGRREGTERVD